MKKNLGITIGASVGSLLVGGGITAAVVIPMALEARDGLENFVVAGKDSASHSIKGKDEINYVALGDSIAAGYNGFLRTEGPSYPEYLEASLENHGVDVNLDNIAVSGYRRGDVIKQLGEPEVIKKLADADLVTTTIGGNDLLAILQLFDLSYTDFQTLLGEAGVGSFDSTSAFMKYGVQTIDNEEIKERLVNSLTFINEIADGTRSSSDIFAFDETISQGNLLDSLQKQYMEHAWWINRLSDAAHLYVSAPNPFASYPQELLDATNSRIPGGYTIATYYDYLMGKITKSVTTGYDDENIKWSHAVSINDDKYDELWTDQLDNTWDYAGTYTGTTVDGYYAGTNPYIDGADSIYLKNPLANSGDIHPSMYGYELMGEVVFDKVADLADITVDETKVQRSEAYSTGTSEWERADENPLLFTFTGDPAADAVVGGRITTLDAYKTFLTLDKYQADALDFSTIKATLDALIDGINAVPASDPDYINNVTKLFKQGLGAVMTMHFGLSKVI